MKALTMMRLRLLFLALVPFIGASPCTLPPVKPSAEIPRLENEVCKIQSTLQRHSASILRIQNLTEVITELEQKIDKLMSNMTEKEATEVCN